MHSRPDPTGTHYGICMRGHGHEPASELLSVGYGGFVHYFSEEEFHVFLRESLRMRLRLDADFGARGGWFRLIKLLSMVARDTNVGCDDAEVNAILDAAVKFEGQLIHYEAEHIGIEADDEGCSADNESEA